ncbi:putative metalloendopeptidase [Saccharomycopsis crataegensis]|uniref:Metalloendopeptidase n=1 Tax=Saccharomycopsis crataegensis TaxID=43959 RepID=A0AAV5QLU4_9ASCO|nr:putative metalloendopeptidase [Saccharomycopsis crataegensis]
MTLTIINQAPGTTVFIPDVLLHGTSSEKYGLIQVRHHQGNFPPQTFEVNSHNFKLLVHLVQGENELIITQYSGKFVNGVPHYDQTPTYRPIQLTYHLNYKKMVENPTTNLCLLLAKDSPGVFDSPEYKIKREGNDINTAVRKLRFGARLMEAFTSEQMRRNGFGNRCFRFTEEAAIDSLSSQERGNVQRETVKVHVIRMDQTVAEIHDPNVAQQNPNGNNTGALFGWAADAVRKYMNENPGLESFKGENFQASCMIMDAHWDPSQNLLLGHAALGGNAGNLRLAIFGSQGLWSWPTCYEELYSAYSDCTKIDTSVCVNDCNECGSAWEALNISLGAFLHEIGHHLGCPHQPNGVMLRDYVILNRTFMTREFPCIRTGKPGYEPVLPTDECTWNRLDIMRFLYHPSFRIPIDFHDDTIIKNAWEIAEEPVISDMENRSIFVTANTGVYLVEIHVDGNPRAQLEFPPRLSNNGPGPQKELVLSYQDLQNHLRPEFRGKPMKLEILSVGLKQATVENDTWEDPQRIEHDFGLGRGTLAGFVTRCHGNTNNDDTGIIPIYGHGALSNIRVFHGGALDGIEFVHPESRSSTLFGKRTNGYSDVPIDADESVVSFNVRCGAWVDAVQVVTNKKVTPWYGNANGGHGAVIQCPTGYQLVALKGTVGGWVNSIQGIYIRRQK